MEKLEIMRRGHHSLTMIELLVVVAIIGILLATLLPSLQSARERAMVIRASAEIKQITDALEGYGFENNSRFPPARSYCDTSKSECWCELPQELVNSHWLPAGDKDSLLSAKIEDIFQPGHTYKYTAPGLGYHNGSLTWKTLWVPDAFPNDGFGDDVATQSGKNYDDRYSPKNKDGSVIPSPVRWVVYSVGPGYAVDQELPERYPIPKRTWYHGYGSRGVIPRIRTTDSMQISLP